MVGLEPHVRDSDERNRVAYITDRLEIVKGQERLGRQILPPPELTALGFTVYQPVSVNDSNRTTADQGLEGSRSNFARIVCLPLRFLIRARHISGFFPRLE